MSGYPSGPPTTPPEDVILTSLTDPVFVVLWVYVAAVGAAMLLWTAIRLASAKKHPSQHEGDVDKGTEGLAPHGSLKDDLGIELARIASKTSQRMPSETRRHDDTQDETKIDLGLPEPELEWICYKNNTFGTVCYHLLAVTSAVLMGIYWVIIIEKYWHCEFFGIDNLCFFGSYPLSGGYMANGTFFFAFWWVCLVFFGLLIAVKVKARNFFRTPCDTREAQFIWLWVPLEEEVLMKAATPLVSLLRVIKTALSSKHNGYEVTAPVLTTPVGTRYYELQASRYVMTSSGHFQRAVHTPVKQYEDAHKLAGGMSSDDAAKRLDFVGHNAIPFEPDTWIQAIKDEFFTPFYLYQLMVYMVWLWFSYLVVGACLAAVVLISGTAKIVIKRKNQQTIAALTKQNTTCEVKRSGSWVTLESSKLVPGDVVKIRSDWLLPCDMAILEGQCVCNESALTGEAMPVQKVQVPSDPSGRQEEYDPATKGKRYTLFSGTTVLQCGDGKPEVPGQAAPDTLALVTSTGINTSKGDILSAILFPTGMTFRYDEELPAAVFLLFLYAIFAFAMSLYLLSTNGSSSDFVTNWCYAVFTVSQILSPLLPVALIAGQVQATVRLSEKGVFCINPTRIAIAGKIRVYCFDKTGTLTTDTLDFLGAREVALTSGGGAVLSPFAHPEDGKEALSRDMTRALASCHAVAKFGETFVGNQVEVKMFSATGWQIVTNPDNTVKLHAPGKIDELTVLRRFEFDHAKQLMSVIVRDSNGAVTVFTKGSFEKVAECTTPDSIPPDYQTTARGMALEGCYVLGLSCKTLEGLSDDEIAIIDRDSVEKDLNLMGLIGFRNELKHDTAQAIGDLKDGDVRPVMITGDNAQCGHYIAQKCGMSRANTTMLLGEIDPAEDRIMWSGMTLEDQESHKPIPTSALYKPEYLQKLESGELELAVTGKAYEYLKDYGDLDRLLFFIRCFARVTPANKIDVVKQFVERDLIVGMCGDGGNDCGALRVAHAGMALSDAEASVVSPFTSKSKTCVNVVDLLREGKAALHTNLSSYKFLIMYGQLFSVWKLTAFYYGVLPSMLCYLMVDVIAVVGLTYALTCARPTAKLNPERPTSSLFSPTTLASVLGNLIINLAFYFGVNMWIPNLAGYMRWPSEVSNGGTWWVNGDNWESTGIYWTIYFQFITSAYIFGFGAQYKQFVVKNWVLTLFYAVLFFIGSWVLLANPDVFTRAFHVASEQFNYVDVIEDNPQSVWATYQTNWELENPRVAKCSPDLENSVPCSPAMSLAQRGTMYGIIMFGLVLACLWQSVVVDRVGKRLSAFHNSTRLVFNL
eukprot:jgi/Tetstr1/466045/TSEL_010632.t1